MKRALNISDSYNSEKIYIPASRISDILVLAISSCALFAIIYIFFSNYEYSFAVEIFEDIDKRTNGGLSGILLQINSSLVGYVVTKTQIALFPILLLVFTTWVLFIKEFIKTKSGLLIDKNGITYTPILFKPENESIYGVSLEWSDIDRFEISKERFTNSDLLKVYVKPDFVSKADNKLEKFFIDIIEKIPHSGKQRYFEIKRLNANMMEVKKLLEEKLHLHNSIKSDRS